MSLARHLPTLRPAVNTHINTTHLAVSWNNPKYPKQINEQTHDKSAEKLPINQTEHLPNDFYIKKQGQSTALLSVNKPSLASFRYFSTSLPALYGSNYLYDPENRGKRQTGVNFDTLGSWNDRMNLSVNVEQSIKAGRLVPSIPLDNVGIGSLLGRRKINEDRAKVCQITEDILMVGVFDGHGGHIASDYVSTAMENHIRFWLERGEKKLTNILHKAYLDVNNAFTKYLYHNYMGSDSALNTGTTATVALLRNGVELVVAQVGDSRALLCRDGSFIQLNVSHNLDDTAEKKRVEQNGGRVVMDSLGIPRVNGRLEMSRSIGDVDLKNFGVIAEPSLRSIEVKHGRDAFLILLSDGITYVLNNQEIIDIVCTCSTPAEAANHLCDQALSYGTEDNCTALVVPYGAWGKYAETKKINFSFGRNTIGKRYM